MVKICVIALVGLPASGKTTFCKTILNSTIECTFVHLCYDEIFTFVPENSEVDFKEERRKVLKKIQQTIESIKSSRSEGAVQTNTNDYVIICDDNNYYSGMRYEIYKICKQNQLSFGQIYFPVDLASVLSRNCLRGDSSLPSSVIEKMNSRLEEPSKKNKWERNTFTIRNSFELEELHLFLKVCLNNPLISTSKDEELGSGRINAIHEIDILLRKRIKELLQTTEGDLTKRAKELNERRKNILLGAKNRHISEKELDVEGILKRLLSD